MVTFGTGLNVQAQAFQGKRLGMNTVIWGGDLPIGQSRPDSWTVKWNGGRALKCTGLLENAWGDMSPVAFNCLVSSCDMCVNILMISPLMKGYLCY